MIKCVPLRLFIDSAIYVPRLQRDYDAPSAWAVMERFGQVNGFLELNGPDIHRLENVMTMQPDVHAFFDRLALWLEATVNASLNSSGAWQLTLITLSRSSILTMCVPDTRISQLVFLPQLPLRPHFPSCPCQTHDTSLCTQRVPKWLIFLVQDSMSKERLGSSGWMI